MSGKPVGLRRRLQRVVAGAIPDESLQRPWLIEQVWGEAGVGVIGGEPKSFKTFLALDMAVAVASGRPCLRTYAVPRPGPVLLFAAEDAAPQIRGRLEGICRAAGTELAPLPIHLIVEDQVLLDEEEDRAALVEAVQDVQPRLLILDPFVRLHRGADENSAGTVAPLLGFLRSVQRRFGTAVAVVHHTRKARGATRAGQSLRGSSDFHAWGDSNLYLVRHAEGPRLTIEHRSAPSYADLPLEVRHEGGRISLARVEPGVRTPGSEAAARSPEEAILAALEAEPLTLAALHQAVRLRRQTLLQLVRRLTKAGRLRRDAERRYSPIR